jgi:alkylated DNA repair dioxygenase AlkB
MSAEIIYNHDNSLVYIVRDWLPKQSVLDIAPNKNNDIVSREQMWSDLEKLPMEQHTWQMYGNSGLKPRFEYACGDDGIDYHSYSNGKSKIKINPWVSSILKCRDRVERESSVIFNSSLINRYDTEKHHLLPHQDREAMGRNNEVVTISVGQSRRCRFYNHDKRFQFEVWLHDGDLLLMYGNVQKILLHEIPSEKFECGRRYSVTFRLLALRRLPTS